MPSLEQSLITAWTLSSTTFMLLMTVGYTLIESAQVRKKNRQFVVTKNMMIFLISLVSFFVIGYAFAFGESSGGIIGAQSNYVGVYSTNNLYHERQFPFYFATCLIVITLVTGSMAERSRLEVLIGFAILLSTIIYPIIMSWTWNLQGGWLRNLGYFDRGGSVVIFQTGSLAGIIGAIVLGPRYGRFMPKNDESKITTIPQANIKKKTLASLLEDAANETIDADDLFLRKIRKMIKRAGEENDFYTIDNQMMVLGTFIIVIGWAMLNACGSGNHNINNVGNRYNSELAYMNTFISGSFSAILSFLLKRYIVRGDHLKTQRYDIRSLCNGYLAGVAAVSAGAGTMKPWSALVTGSVEAFLYMTLCLIFKKVQIDDPMENFQIYGSASFGAMFSSAFFLPNKGILWGGSYSGSILGIQLLGWAIISVWTILISWLFFYCFKKCKVLRLKKAEEVLGLDTITYARNKGIDITLLMQAISKTYPATKKKGC